MFDVNHLRQAFNAGRGLMAVFVKSTYTLCELHTLNLRLLSPVFIFIHIQKLRGKIIPNRCIQAFDNGFCLVKEKGQARK